MGDLLVSIMIHHEKFMREIEAQMHGTMYTQERLDQVSKIVQNWVIDMEEEHNAPFSKIPVNQLPPLNRQKTLDYIKSIHSQNQEGRRGKVMEAYCKGERDACISINAEILVGKLE